MTPRWPPPGGCALPGWASPSQLSFGPPPPQRSSVPLPPLWEERGREGEVMWRKKERHYQRLWAENKMSRRSPSSTCINNRLWVSILFRAALLSSEVCISACMHMCVCDSVYVRVCFLTQRGRGTWENDRWMIRVCVCVRGWFPEKNKNNRCRKFPPNVNINIWLVTVFVEVVNKSEIIHLDQKIQHKYKCVCW